MHPAVTTMRQPTRPNCRSSLAPHLPTSRAASALLYVKATAGLRLLPVLQAELLLAAVGVYVCSASASLIRLAIAFLLAHACA